MAESIEGLFDPITSGDLRGWHGLPRDLSLPRLTSAFPADSDWSGSARLGSNRREANYRWIRFPGAGGQCRAWFTGEWIILLDIANPPVTVRPDQLTEIFGEPDASLDAWQATLPMSGAELVYPGLGLAVFVNRDTQAIWHLALFPPVTLDTYQDDLRIALQTRRR